MGTMKIRKSDDFYQEALVWMGYRYAIGLTGAYPAAAERWNVWNSNP